MIEFIKHNVHGIIIISQIIGVIFIILGVIGFYQLFKDLMEAEKMMNKMFNEISEIKTPEEWLVTKGKVVNIIQSRYRKEFKESMSRLTLYGQLAEKAEMLFKNQKK